MGLEFALGTCTSPHFASNGWVFRYCGEFGGGFAYTAPYGTDDSTYLGDRYLPFALIASSFTTEYHLTSWLHVGLTLGYETRLLNNKTEVIPGTKPGPYSGFARADPSIVAAFTSVSTSPTPSVPNVVPSSAVVERPGLPESVASETTFARSESPRPSPPPTTAASARPSLPDEVRLLDTARQALSRGNTAGAKTLVVEHRHRFPRGALTTDVAYLEVEIAHAQGQAAELRRLATAFLTRYPRDTHASRVRHLLEQ